MAEVARTYDKELRRLRAFVAREFKPTDSLTGNGVTRSVASWIAAVDAEIRFKDALGQARLAFRLASKADMDRRDGQRQLVADLSDAVKIFYPKGSPTLKAAGLRHFPGRPAGKKGTVAERAAALAKRGETRAKGRKR